LINSNLLNNPFVFSTDRLSSSAIFDYNIELDYGYFYFNRETVFSKIELDGTTLILIGYVLDIRDGLKGEDQILNELLEKYLNKHSEEDSFYAFLDFLNGRYVLLFSNQNDTNIYTDATSMAPLFYYKNNLFSSHEIILRELIKGEYDIQLNVSEYSMKNFLDYTDTEEIYSFNPNLFYSGMDHKFYRYFPRKKFKNQTLNEVLQNTDIYYSHQLNWLKNSRRNIYLSLTGGFDSKLSLAIVKPIINDIQTFTYMYRFWESENYNELNQYRKIYYKDQVIVNNLVYNFNLNHKFFYFEDYEVPSEYLSEIGKHVSSNHSYKLSYLTAKEFKSNSVHLKSTLYELAKLPYNGSADMRTEDELMIQSIKRFAPNELQQNYKELNKMYQNYIERNLVDEIIEYGYNLPLMLYWEFRMGNWHSSITQETDFIVDTFIFINCRFLLDQLISLSMEDRKNNKYLTSIIKRNWPALNYFVANSFDTLEDLIEIR